MIGFLEDGSSPHWSEMTASCMLGLDEEGEVVEAGSMGGGPEVTASCIHLGVRRDVSASASLSHKQFWTRKSRSIFIQLIPLP